MFFSKTLSVNKIKQLLQDQYDIYLKHPSDERFKRDLVELEALTKENPVNRKEATRLAKSIEEYSSKKYKKPIFKSFFDIALALGVALIAATVIRQMWFELYEIPTGSMRPTFREQDHVAVTKTAYGLNIPLKTDHFYFDPEAVNRGGVVIFSGDGLDLSDTDSTFLYIFPYKKRYVKRLIGKPGDTLYFYGGRIFGQDKDGHAIKDFENAPWIEKLEYVPINNFEGKIIAGTQGKLTLKQMNTEIAHLTLSPFGEFQGEFLTSKGWVKDQPSQLKSPHNTPVAYTELWGLGNYAKSRIVTDKEGKKSLEISHHPSLVSPAPTLSKESRGFSFSLTPQKSFLPLDEELLSVIMDNMYTARFIVKNGRATRYSQGNESITSTSPKFQGVPDGTYEFYYGKGYKVGWGGTLSELNKDHPLMSKDISNIEKLYNMGMEVDTSYDPTKQVSYLPARYAYYRNGDLYLMGAPFLKKGDSRLVTFEEQEEKNKNKKDYQPFLDNPVSTDSDFLANFGMKVPDKHYLVLGDNHAMSGDSRYFGFVPEANMQGAPSMIMWPFSERIGFPSMVPYKLINPSRLIVWAIALLGFGTWWYLHRRRLNRPIV